MGGYSVSNGSEYEQAVAQILTPGLRGQRKVLTPLLFCATSSCDIAAEEASSSSSFAGSGASVTSDPTSRAAAPPETAAPLEHALSREEAILAGKERLAGRLRKIGLREIVMQDDGNCQFRALSAECFGTQDWHHNIRGQVVEYIERHAADFRPFFPG